MKTPKKGPRIVSLDEAPEAEASALLYTDEPPADYETGSADPLCPVCGDLLAWHEQACVAAPALSATATTDDDDTPAARPPAPTSTFAYPIGHRVQPAASAPATVTWRGQHKERHPATGLVQRINVYFLDNGYWDCYREDELQAA
ncbi:hypothetical protein ACFQ48_16720 [Hymenobacter caeli]|uniref:Uncharacterized protein n=1 Tax=Hymenobacter caeli TaxID=2735894 RepID=A0ABX2FQA1_9BACT|nr:hypothetical protein [Hymenobacter caeli]NRT19348.1 hypothetical protein [Hymenobacter caeli]